MLPVGVEHRDIEALGFGGGAERAKRPHIARKRGAIFHRRECAIGAQRLPGCGLRNRGEARALESRDQGEVLRAQEPHGLDELLGRLHDLFQRTDVGRPVRIQSLRRRGAEVGPLLIAGFISPSPRFAVPFRLAVGLGYRTLMLLLLSGKLIPRPKAAEG